jgi:hypothetical protein
MFISVMIAIGYIGISFVYIYTTWRLYVYNEISSDAFEFSTVNGVITSLTEDENDIVIVNYNYRVATIHYEDHLRIGKLIVERAGYKNGDTVTIHYNTSFPSVSYIQNLYTVDRDYSLYLFFLPFLIIVIWATFANKDKWIERYRRGFGWPTEN